ncbi:MAG: DNA repair protein RadC [Bacilli bacterium]|nr:DNA repair protein RadC [Bacilli bacterium]
MKTMIKQIPKELRPRERLIKLGAKYLSDDELLSIILKTGTKGISVKDLSLNILSLSKGISNLKDMNYHQFLKIQGIGSVKACELSALVEISKRMNEKKLNLEKIKFNNPEIVYEFYKEELKDKKQEYFNCLYLDNKKHLIKDLNLFIGTLNQSLVHPREVFKNAITLSASSIICVHNHPSGDVTPSILDKELTMRLKEVGHMLGIPVDDHIIIGNEKYYSFYENDEISLLKN